MFICCSLISSSIKHSCTKSAYDKYLNALQEWIREQEELIPLEQAARGKVTDLKSVMDSERSQGSVLKAILQAKLSNQIEGIYGRMGDLGAIDG